MFYILCSRCAAKGLEICEQHLPQALLDAMARPNPYIFIWPNEPEPQYIKTSFAEMIDLSKYEFIYFKRNGDNVEEA